MFYVKTKIGEGCTLRTEITDENTYTICVNCGDEIQVDLNEAIIDGCLDLFGMGMRCEECSYKHAEKHRGELWAQQILMEKAQETSNPPMGT